MGFFARHPPPKIFPAISDAMNNDSRHKVSHTSGEKLRIRADSNLVPSAFVGAHKQDDLRDHLLDGHLEPKRVEKKIWHSWNYTLPAGRGSREQKPRFWRLTLI